MRCNIKGISLIALIITIAVIVILAAVTVQKGVQRTDQAKLAKHNTNISNTQEEVENYYYYKGAELPVVNLTPYPVSSNTGLLAEITKNNEQNDSFFIVDLSKLGKTSGKDGSGDGDDIYIVSSTRHNVYYVKGTTVKGITYYGLISKNDIKLAQITGGPTPTLGGVTSTPTVTPTATLTPTPTNSPTPTPIPNGAFDGTVNSPKLSAGMTAVKWNGSSWVTANTSNAGNDWYDYSKPTNKWANAKLADGSLLVWIPRYTYNITSGFHTATAGNIDIKFSNGTTDDTSNSYIAHPAFYWGGWNIPISAPMTKQGGGTELTGIWVGKFESSNSSSKIKIVPNVSSWRNISVDSIFTTCREMQTLNSSAYGISTDSAIIDTHMLKNSEWAAVAYLTKYILGSTRVSNNSNQSFITANGDILVNKVQSTTRTEYGIYDMNGCSWEHLAAHLDDSSAESEGSSLYIASAKYKDVYPEEINGQLITDIYEVLSQAYGHAIYETSSQKDGFNSWFGEYSRRDNGSCRWIYRGGDCYSGSSGGIFALNEGFGIASNNNSFRLSICVP